MNLIDSHAHLHDPVLKLDPERVLERAKSVGVSKIITIGTDAVLSQAAVDFATAHQNVFATAGLHPHEATKQQDLDTIERLAHSGDVVGIGECGLDYYYHHASKKDQIQVFKWQLQLAESLELPLSLHIRGSKEQPGDAFDAAYKLLRQHKITGVVHSFTGGVKQLEQALELGLYIGLNGIMTFSQDPEHQLVVRDVPLDRLLLESDAPFLTPVPFRGRINEPKYVELTAAFIADVKGVPKTKISAKTSANAERLFVI